MDSAATPSQGVRRPKPPCRVAEPDVRRRSAVTCKASGPHGAESACPWGSGGAWGPVHPTSVTPAASASPAPSCWSRFADQERDPDVRARAGAASGSAAHAHLAPGVSLLPCHPLSATLASQLQLAHQQGSFRDRSYFGSPAGAPRHRKSLPIGFPTQTTFRKGIRSPTEAAHQANHGKMSSRRTFGDPLRQRLSTSQGAPPGDMWQRLETFSVVTTWGESKVC